MSSYCEVCRGLFDMPHEHSQFVDFGHQKRKHTCCNTTISPRRAASSSFVCIGRKRNNDCHSVPASASGRCGGLSPERRYYTSGRPESSSVSTATGARRDTVCSLLRRSPPSARGAALVRTPNNRGDTPSSCWHLRNGECFVAPTSKKDVQSLGSSGVVAGRRLDTLHRTLERIREAVRLDRKDAFDAAKGSLRGKNIVAAAHVDSGEDVFFDSCHEEDSSYQDESNVTNKTVTGRGCRAAADDAANVLSAADQHGEFLRNIGADLCTTECSSSLTDVTCGGIGPLRDFRKDVLPLPPSAPSCDNDSSFQERVSSVALPAARAEQLRKKDVTSLSAGTQTLQLHPLPSPGRRSFYSSAGRGEIGSSKVLLTHLGTLREGFVELCSAVREDLHALHVRVNEIERQLKELRQGDQRYQYLQQTGSEGVSCQQATERTDGSFATKINLPVSYDVFLNELQQHILLTVHKVFQQQEKHKQRHRKQMEPVCDSCGAAPHLSGLSQFCSSERFLAENFSPAFGMFGMSLEAFDAYVRSAVRAILCESDFRPDTEGAVAKQRMRERNVRTSQRECQRCCAELEKQLAVLVKTVESTRLDVEEMRLAAQPSVQRLPHVQSAAAAAEISKTTIKSATSEVCEERLMGRVQRLLANAEEQWSQCAQRKIVQPALEHVRKLMSAHQSMIDTVVENRCAQFEAYIDRGRHAWELQLVDLRSRLSSFRGDVHRALSELSGKLNVSCPGL